MLGGDREASLPREEADFALAPRPLAFTETVTCPLVLYLIIYHVLVLFFLVFSFLSISLVYV